MMFERFSKGTRDVVKGAVEHVEQERAERVDEGHLLHLLLDRRGTRGTFVLDALGVREQGRCRAIGETAGATWPASTYADAISWTASFMSTNTPHSLRG